MTWLLKLYPRAWRQRYEAEVAEVVADQSPSIQLVVDLLGGAVDAHLNPQAFARQPEAQPSAETGGSRIMSRWTDCELTKNVTPRDTWIAAGLTILSGLVVAGILMIDRSQMTEAITLSMFPAVLAAPMQWIYLRGHSNKAKVVLFVLPFVICFGIGLTAGMIVTD